MRCAHYCALWKKKSARERERLQTVESVPYRVALEIQRLQRRERAGAGHVGDPVGPSIQHLELGIVAKVIEGAEPVVADVE